MKKKKQNKSGKRNEQNAKNSKAQNIKSMLFFLIAISTMIYFFNRSGNQVVNAVLACIAIASAVSVTFINARLARNK